MPAGVNFFDRRRLWRRGERHGESPNE